MNIAALKAFVAAAEQQSFSRAAEILHLTQPGLSKRIVGLENELKHSLFERLSNGVLLTDAGRLLLPHAQQILERSDDIKLALLGLDNELCGRLRFGTTQHLALYHLQSVLQQFTSNFHAVDLSIDFHSSSEAEKKVLSGALDMAYITQPPDVLPQLNYQSVAEERLVFVAAKAHPLSRVKQLTLDDLAAFKAILPPKSSHMRMYIDQIFSQASVALNVTEPSRYLEVLRLVAASGLGWTVLAEKMLDDRFTRLPLPDYELCRSLVVVSHKERQLSPPCHALLAALMPEKEEP